MRFGLYMPPNSALTNAASADLRIAAVVFLAGLTCNEETFAIKAGAQAKAAELGLALIMPDTSPRGANVVGEADAWDFGLAASFYLDATQEPWRAHYQMASYVASELISVVAQRWPIDVNRVGIMGHSMGGHGALTLALKHPAQFKSVSAIAPICAPTQCPWGKKALSGYLGDDAASQNSWAQHDASALMQACARGAPFPSGILIDQGLADKFLLDQLNPDHFDAACEAVGQPLRLRRQVGYDHGYYFVASVIDDHLAHHHARLAQLV